LVLLNFDWRMGNFWLRVTIVPEYSPSQCFLDGKANIWKVNIRWRNYVV